MALCTRIQLYTLRSITSLCSERFCVVFKRNDEDRDFWFWSRDKEWNKSPLKINKK